MNCIEFSRGYGKSTGLLYHILLGDTDLIRMMLRAGYDEIIPCLSSLISEVTEGQSEKIMRELLCQNGGIKCRPKPMIPKN